MSNPVSYRGRGSVIQLSPDGVTYTALPQLDKFDHSGGDVTKVETTCLDSPGTGKFWQPVDTDHKDWDFSGILDPQNLAIQQAAVYFQTMALIYFKVTLPDSPATIFAGQCYMASFKLLNADVKDTLKFAGKLLIQGNPTWQISGSSAVTV